MGYSGFQRSYSLLADDALAAVHTLGIHPGVDQHKVGIWGFSEGGWVAPLAASRSDSLAFVIVVGANAIPPLQQQTWEVSCALQRQNVSGSLVKWAEPNMYRLLAGIGMYPEAYYNAETVLRHVRQPLLGIWGGAMICPRQLRRILPSSPMPSSREAIPTTPSVSFPVQIMLSTKARTAE